MHSNQQCVVKKKRYLPKPLKTWWSGTSCPFVAAPLWAKTKQFSQAIFWKIIKEEPMFIWRGKISGGETQSPTWFAFPKLALKASFLGVIISMKRSGALVLYGPSYLVVTLQKHEPAANMKPPLNYSVTVLKASKHQFMVSIT